MPSPVTQAELLAIQKRLWPHHSPTSRKGEKHRLARFLNPVLLIHVLLSNAVKCDKMHFAIVTSALSWSWIQYSC